MALLAYGLLRSRSRDRLRRLIRDAPTSVLASPSAAIQPSVRRPDGLVHFHPAREPITTGSDHRAPQFMQPRPGRPITAQSKDPLQTQRAGAVLLAGHIPHRPKPDRQRLPRVLEHRASRHRGLVVAARTLEQGGTHRPHLATSATWASEALRPPQVEEVLATSLLGREAGLELL